MRVFALALTLLLGLLQYALWDGKNGIVDYQSVTADIASLSQVNGKLKERNQEMFIEIDDLRQGLDATEERARNELGMIKEDETFFRVVGEDKVVDEK